jgi:hypothetical protein
MSEFIFQATHRLYYSTERPVPIGDIAKSLLALEKLILSSEALFEGLTAVDIDKIEVLVSKIESGSLAEDVLIKFFFKDQAGLDAFIAKLREKTLENGLMGKSVLVASVLAILVGTGALYAAMQSKSGNTSTITANNNVIINIGAGEVGMTPEAFKSVVDAAIKDRQALAENTVQLFKPARADKNAAITFDNNEQVKFSPEVIAATPTTSKAAAQDHAKDYSDVDLQIRATDLDSQKRGWAGVVPALFERRIPLKLAENVNPSDLNQFQVRADITVFYKRQKRGSGNELMPDYIMVRNIIK